MAESPAASPAPAPAQATPLEERLAALGRVLGEREASHGEGLERARRCAATLREEVERAVERFHRAAAEAGAPHLRVELSALRTDDKHLRAVEFDLRRGRYRAIVTAKSRGDLTLVGPFRQGRNEGPCKSFPPSKRATRSRARWPASSRASSRRRPRPDTAARPPDPSLERSLRPHRIRRAARGLPARG